jgi:tetratricopeptide (TPR) repeat protein
VTARRPSAAEWLVIAAGLLVFGYAGWDGALWDPRWQLALHLLAIAAIGGLGAVALGGGRLPRTRIDIAILGLLTAFALATASAENDGLALRAMAAIVGTAAMLPVALVVLRRHPGWTALVVIVPTLGLATASLALMIGRRVEWYLAAAPGLLPPVRMIGEGTPFGSVAVPPFVLLGLVPLTLVIPSPRWRRWLQGALALAGVPLTLLSGSRSAWLAIGVATAVLALTVARSRGVRVRLPRRWRAREVGIATLAIGAGALGLAFIAPRALAVTSLIYRGNLWSDTLAAWSTDPLLGIGPGTMPYARQAAAEPLSFPVQQPHSHNLLLGVLGDAGLVGLVAALVLVLVFAWVAGPWRSRSVSGRAAASVLAGFAVAGLFEDLTFVPGFNLLVILCVAIALADAGAVDWVEPPRLGTIRERATPAALALGAVVLLVITITGDAAAIAYRLGTDAVARGDWPAAARWLERAVELDPWHPTGPKALTVVADEVGDGSLALASARRAVELYAGDGASWANLAILCQRDGQSACAVDAAGRAVGAATLFGPEPINAALTYAAIDEPGRADDAYRVSLLVNRLTSLAVDWPRVVELDGATAGELDVQALELNRVLAAAAAGEPLDASPVTDPAVRALAAAIEGDREQAESALAESIATQPASLTTWEAALVLRRHWGEPLDDALRIYAAVRGRPAPDPDATPGVGGLSYDIATFRAFPLDGLLRGAEHLTPPRAWPWALEAVLPPAAP